jgi:hypothetical protein
MLARHFALLRLTFNTGGCVISKGCNKEIDLGSLFSKEQPRVVKLARLILVANERIGRAPRMRGPTGLWKSARESCASMLNIMMYKGYGDRFGCVCLTSLHIYEGDYRRSICRNKRRMLLSG